MKALDAVQPPELNECEHVCRDQASLGPGVQGWPDVIDPLRAVLRFNPL